MRLAILLTLLAPIALANAQPVALDPAFGTGGIVHHMIDIYYDKINDVVLQPDGKIVVTGYTIQVNANWNLVVVRYNEDGSFDPSFGNSGVVITDIGPSHEEGTAITLQPDGRILVSGYTWVVDANGTTAYIVAARYLADGALDPSFGTGGISLQTTGYPSDYAYSITLQPDGRILLGGSSDGNSYAVLRLNDDGTPDLGFGVDGWAVAMVVGINSTGHCVALQPDGRIVLAGDALIYNADSTNANQDLAAVRFMADGTLDLSFGTQGQVITDMDGTGVRADLIRDVAIQPDGAILLCGLTVASDGAYDVGMVRYLYDGSLDPSFGNGGRVITDFENSSQDPRALMVLADGRILLGGVHYYDFAAMRYLPNGTPDNSFDGDGLVHTAIDSLSYEYGNAIAMYPDGRLVVAGETTYMCYQRKFGLVRYTTDMSTALAEKPIAARASVVPNPVNDMVAVTLSEPLPQGGNWILSDASGRQVSTGRIAAGSGQRFLVAMGVLANGAYTITISGSGRTMHAQVVKE